MDEQPISMRPQAQPQPQQQLWKLGVGLMAAAAATATAPSPAAHCAGGADTAKKLPVRSLCND